MEVASAQFRSRSKDALLNEELQAALQKARGGFVDKRKTAVDDLTDFDHLRDRAVAIKNQVLTNLDRYLEQYENNVIDAGGHVHWASTPQQAVEIILDICRGVDARCVTKGKSMIGEEMSLNDALEEQGIEVVETDLGEYIIQLAKERPSHIIAPAIHKTRNQITELFHEHHAKYGLTQKVEEVATIVNEARTVLREQFVKADVGITGANFLLADSGCSVLVTNEGNGDLTSTLPKVHIVTASIEKLIPSIDDLSVFLRILARSATGQEMSSYTSIYGGSASAEGMDETRQYHVVMLDNGRSKMLEGEFWEMLRCIRCGACMNHCPVYQSIGGHAYGWVYPGPMGSVWTPLLVGLQNAANLPNACTLNGRCEEVCPVRIPLPKLLRSLRNQIFERGLIDWKSRLGLWTWKMLTLHPPIYRLVMNSTSFALGWMGRRSGSIRRLPFGGGWTQGRDFPASTGGGTFVSQWKSRSSD
ncbi:MAG: LutB/LldF family L-lactate oxidation iron-sulfur protein [Acidiferrobacterales bacterium]|nr:LutB/LldF family L-lactate oxidation iron-sulfur protein [Acidiferrobacterales bacterium]